MPVTEYLERNAREYPDEVALVELNPDEKDTRRTTWKEFGLIEPTTYSPYRREITWSVFNEKANRFANMLIGRGIKKGDKVAIIMYNCLEWLPIYFGVLKTGAIAVPFNFRYDSDGISPMNLAKVYAGDPTGYGPCTAEAVIEMLDYAGVDLKGKRAVVIGRSLVIGKPVAMMLMKKNATVTVCHTKTVDMPGVCKGAEVLVAAAGVAKMVDKSFVADGAVVIDVGINVDEDGNLCGDVDFEDVAGNASVCTPVPGGVGSVTTSVLAKHLLKAAKARRA